MERRIMKKTISALLSLILTAVFLGSCSEVTGEEKEINIAIGSPPITIDPQLAYDTGSAEVISFFMTTLYTYNSDNELVPGLAESYEVSQDGRVYTFHLKEGLRWSNGRPILAEDFVFGARRLADPDVGSNSIYLITDCCALKNADEISLGEKPLNELGVSSPDSRTVVYELEDPCPYFLALITMNNFSPCCEDFCSSVGSDYANSEKTILSCGPYIIDRYEPLAMQVHFSKNPYYFDADKIKTDGVTLQVVSNNQQSLMCYESEVVDVMAVQGEIAELAVGDPELKIYPSASITYMDINHRTNSALANKNIRMALCKSIDRADLTENLLKAGNAPLTRIVPPGFYRETDGSDFAGDTSRYDEYAVYDPDAAGKLWKQGLSDLGISSVTLNLVYNASSAPVAEAITAHMKRTLPGLEIDLKPVTLKERSRMHEAGEYDLIIVGWVADYCDPTAFLSQFVSSAHKCVFNDPVYDEIYETCQSEETANDAERRNSLMHDAESVLMENTAAVPLYTTGEAYLVRDSVKGFRLTPTGVGLIVTDLEKEAV
ncbi:MAG: peptide ABC transporter substrate-binding protein [Ruminiclostridium sp.]|nr:peptide ABC transporter substrate-binding protein [Ruminiclostridium sp.]